MFPCRPTPLLLPALLSLALTMWCARTSLAVEDQYLLTGTVLASPQGPIPTPYNTIRAGDSFSLVLCIDPAAPDLAPDEHTGLFTAIESARCTFTSCPLELSQSTSRPGAIRVTDNDPLGYDGWQASFTLPNARGLIELWTDEDNLWDADSLSPCEAFPPLTRFTHAFLDLSFECVCYLPLQLDSFSCVSGSDCAPCPQCPADFNKDGAIDGADLDAFFTSWEDSNACADINQDGAADGSDISAFFARWELGQCCPSLPDRTADGLVDSRDLIDFWSAFSRHEPCTDLNGDGRFDVQDFSSFWSAWISGGGRWAPWPCNPDFNRDGAVDCNDWCGFAGAFAENDSSADLDATGATDRQDATWFWLAYVYATGEVCTQCCLPPPLLLPFINNAGCWRPLSTLIDSASPVADFDCSGLIDAADAAAFRTSVLDFFQAAQAQDADFSLPCPLPSPDLDHNGVLDTADLALIDSLLNSSGFAGDVDCLPGLSRADQDALLARWLDRNHNLVVDCNDYRAFTDEVAAQQPGADLNQDGAVNLDDILEFVQRFSMVYDGPPCP